MLTGIQSSLPPGTLLDTESWVAIKKEIAVQYLVRFTIAVAIAGLVSILVPDIGTMIASVDLPPHSEKGSYAGGAFLIVAFWVWIGLSLWGQRDDCVKIIDAADPVKHAARVRWWLYWGVALFMNAWFALVLVICGPTAAMILVVPGLVGPSYMLATTGAEYYARHVGSEDAKAVCRTIYAKHIVPTMVAAGMLFSIGIVIVFLLFGH